MRCGSYFRIAGWWAPGSSKGATAGGCWRRYLCQGLRDAPASRRLILCEVREGEVFWKAVSLLVKMPQRGVAVGDWVCGSVRVCVFCSFVLGQGFRLFVMAECWVAAIDGVEGAVYLMASSPWLRRISCHSVLVFLCSTPCVGHHYVEGWSGIAYTPRSIQARGRRTGRITKVVGRRHASSLSVRRVPLLAYTSSLTTASVVCGSSSFLCSVRRPLSYLILFVVRAMLEDAQVAPRISLIYSLLLSLSLALSSIEPRLLFAIYCKVRMNETPSCLDETPFQRNYPTPRRNSFLLDGADSVVRVSPMTSLPSPIVPLTAIDRW